MRAALLVLLALGTTACRRAPPPANPSFDDALSYTFRSFNGEEVDLAFAMRQLEQQVYLSMDVTADRNQDRALTPSVLVEDDVFDIERPDRSLTDAIPVAVATVSAYEPFEHASIQMNEDQTPVEPYSPNYYVRTFLLGGDCFDSQTCPRMETHNDLIKDNLLMTVPYWFYKDFRWVDLNLPDPEDVPEGEEAVNDGEPRWGIIARSWTTDTFTGESENAYIHQSFTVEVWIPRDGNGFVRDGTEQNADGGEWTADSTGGGTLRTLALWSETEFDGLNVSDEVVAGTTRKGIDDNYNAQEDFLIETFGAR
ncbi:MAG: hypothetical protein EP330_13060 [Deltaproteobacteria bacterium]|nr:MAG: hypothetical protein EP330_13060 [Deltaproteobacteria bacterium]